MKNPVIAIASADWHTHKFRNFNINKGRLYYSLKIGKEISKACLKYGGVPHLFAGDLIHTPKEVENETIGKFINNFSRDFVAKHIPFMAISGNHDLSEKNTINHKSPSYLDTLDKFPNFVNLGNSKEPIKLCNNIYVHGVSYMNYEQDLVASIKEIEGRILKNTKNILLLHSDMPNAKTPQGFQLDESEYIPRDLSEFFKAFDLVLLGHIHKAQTLAKNCFMLGTPIQLDISQVGEKCGYWKIYKDLTMEHVELTNFPKFIQLKAGEIPSNEFDYFIPAELESQADEDGEVSKFSADVSRSKLAKRYCKVTQVKDKRYINALIKALNETE